MDPPLRLGMSLTHSTTNADILSGCIHLTLAIHRVVHALKYGLGFSPSTLFLHTCLRTRGLTFTFGLANMCLCLATASGLNSQLHLFASQSRLLSVSLASLYLTHVSLSRIHVSSSQRCTCLSLLLSSFALVFTVTFALNWTWARKA